MSLTKFATVENYKASKTKPIVAIRLATVVPQADGNKRLFGYPVNHPNERLNDKLIRSSKIIEDNPQDARSLTTIETQNTIYNVMSWENINV